jgi:mannose/fructose/N-acetylgalactosamine-specific phosphotransferase system component IIB
MKSFQQIAESCGFITEAKEKVFLIKVSGKVNADVLGAWSRSAEANDIVVTKAEQYADDIIKATITKGSAASLKRTFRATGVQNFTALTAKPAEDDQSDITYKNIRKG